jgi:hypothetical protein
MRHSRPREHNMGQGCIVARAYHPVGRPSGGGLSGIANRPGGWLAQPDCVQADATVAPSITAIREYVDDTITQGAYGCSYHHAVGAGMIANLDNLTGAQPA